MPEPDLVLLHAPSIYDFRQEAILYGPIADFAPAPFVFEFYPPGYASHAEYLEHAGYSVRILNLAKCMLDNPQFDAEEVIASLNPIAFGIDFHWLSHAQGALAVAQIVKALHPETPVILQGLAASYYHRDLINYPQVNYILRGDSTEGPLLHLLECLSLARVPDQVPGLTWRTRSEHVVQNPPRVTASSDDLPSRGSNSALSYQKDYPSAIGLMARGCTQNCLTCSGSAYAYQRVHGRQTPDYRAPESLASDLKDVRGYDNGSVYVPCDITQPGMDFAYRFLQAMYGFPKLIWLDLLQPMPRKFLQDLTDALPHLALQISMGSHDSEVRQAVGKHYSNSAIEQTIKDALSLGCKCLNLRFTIGLPHQDYSSVIATVDYCDDLLRRLGSEGRLEPSITPLAPFLDPGSMAFEEPERSGYRLLFQSLEDHRRALLAPTWKHVLNYETEWMTGDDIVRATYDATVAIARLRAKHGLISEDSAEALEALVQRTRRLMAEIECALATDDTDQLQDKLRLLKPEIDAVNQASLWNSNHGVPSGKDCWEPIDARYRGRLGGVRRALRYIRNWPDHGHNSSGRAAKTAATGVSCSWFRPPPM